MVAAGDEVGGSCVAVADRDDGRLRLSLEGIGWPPDCVDHGGGFVGVEAAVVAPDLLVDWGAPAFVEEVRVDGHHLAARKHPLLVLLSTINDQNHRNGQHIKYV